MLEPYGKRGEIGCDVRCNDAPNVAGCSKPGVMMFRDWVLATFGGHSAGIGRPCHIGKTSLHHEGRAWDWGVDATDPEDVERVEALLSFLLKDGPEGKHEMLRRAGIVVIIFDRQIWSTLHKKWRPYGRDPHTDHVHFGFSPEGAMAETSFYRMLGEPGTPLPTPVEPAPVGKTPWAAFGVGASVAFLASTHFGRRLAK